MHDPIAIPDGGFAFLKGVLPYSQGVVALPGFAIERARFARPIPLAEGFRAIAAHLAALGRPRTAFCACELRSPKPFSFAGFGDFNRDYVEVLEQWGPFRDGLNAVARSNVAPEFDPPAEPCFHAFCYTVPAADAVPSFIVAGSGEWPEGGRFPEDIVARGDASAAGLRTKAQWVLAIMAQRLRGLGARDAECERDLALLPPADRRARLRDGPARGQAGARAAAVARRLRRHSSSAPRMPFGM